MKGLQPVTPDQEEAVVDHLRGWLGGRLPGTVAAYLAMGDEIDVTPLFDWLPGWRWVLPRVEDDGSVTFRDRGVPTHRHRLGMLQPMDGGAAVPVNQIDVFLVPGVAFDTDGNRLGRGSGYYDRILRDARADTVTIGVTSNDRMVESIPMDEHDQAVGWVVTEGGIVECPPTRSPGRS
jgi:5-formyltetrahydrofolate cyclo-ligase